MGTPAAHFCWDLVPLWCCSFYLLSVTLLDLQGLGKFPFRLDMGSPLTIGLIFVFSKFLLIIPLVELVENTKLKAT